ncbi:hypothetical protein A9K55_006247 [Cordyceps militaris]|uniref:Uncharacterized protein n=1 Tax=Cordyceps militaris TaxID=73501 RepID=A0A2H4S9W0_CORMI|nr:hypothetical protein A9K55_006247 [Cordyceps militaris]
MQWAALDLFNKKQDPGAAWVEDQDWHHTGQLLRHASSAPNGRATTCKRLSHCLIVVPRVRLSLDAGMSSPRILPISGRRPSINRNRVSPNCDSPSASTAPLRSSDHKCDNTDFSKVILYDIIHLVFPQKPRRWGTSFWLLGSLACEMQDRGKCMTKPWTIGLDPVQDSTQLANFVPSSSTYLVTNY